MKNYIEKYYAQNPNIVRRTIDDEAFLINVKTDSIFHLNPISTGIWQLLRKPMRVDDLTDVVESAFPDTNSKKISTDVEVLVDRMYKKRLLIILE